MRTVKLDHAGVATSSLGFGCSALIGGRSRREAIRLLEVAFESGIRHFDAARLYGTGDAEAVLGAFAAGRRDQITIATKFGIDPLPARAPISIAKHLVRLATRRSRKLRRLARQAGNWTARRTPFTPAEARKSLGASLAALKTGYVDLFLLHDCIGADWQSTLIETLGDLVSSGTVRVFGTATAFRETEVIFAGPQPNPRIVQFEDDVLANNLPAFRTLSHEAGVITHGAFRRLLPVLWRRLGHDPHLAAKWKHRLDADVNRPETLAGLLLAHSLHANEGGVVLFSSGDAGRIVANARIATEMPYDPSQLREFAYLVQAALRHDGGTRFVA